MNREEYNKKLIAEKGQEYLDKNKDLLDAQFDYIESLGDIDDIDYSLVSEVIISKGN